MSLLEERPCFTSSCHCLLASLSSMTFLPESNHLSCPTLNILVFIKISLIPLPQLEIHSSTKTLLNFVISLLIHFVFLLVYRFFPISFFSYYYRILKEITEPYWTLWSPWFITNNWTQNMLSKYGSNLIEYV